MHSIDTMINLMTEVSRSGQVCVDDTDERRIQLEFLVEARLLNWTGNMKTCAKFSVHGAWLFSNVNNDEAKERLRFYYEQYALSGSIQHAMTNLP